jgi:hypothetical protein
MVGKSVGLATVPLLWCECKRWRISGGRQSVEEGRDTGQLQALCFM